MWHQDKAHSLEKPASHKNDSQQNINHEDRGERPQQFRVLDLPESPKPFLFGRLFVSPLNNSARPGPKPKEIKVETFRTDYLIRAPKLEELSLRGFGV